MRKWHFLSSAVLIQLFLMPGLILQNSWAISHLKEILTLLSNIVPLFKSFNHSHHADFRLSIILVTHLSLLLNCCLHHHLLLLLLILHLPLVLLLSLGLIINLDSFHLLVIRNEKLLRLFFTSRLPNYTLLHWSTC